MSRKLLTLRRSLFALLALLIVLTVAQVGPASAEDYGCTPHWGTQVFVTGGPLNIIERCEPVITYDFSGNTEWDWVFLRFALANQDQRRIWQGGGSLAPYKMVVNSLVGGGSGGGAGAAKMILYNPDGTHLNRTIAVRDVMQYQPSGSSSWYTCHDTGWKQASGSAKRTWIWQYDQPDCGPAYYRTLAAGRFWSLSLNKWITHGWLYSPSLWIPWGTAPAEPTSYPTTQTPDTPD